jgi:energy-coupling factor transporter ATP-binding protein EcfA2
VAKFIEQGCRAQILGPHGSGKSTLLATLRPLLATLNRRLEVIDGFEELSLPYRCWTRLACRARGTGLLVTAHRDVGLPTLIELRPRLELVRELVAQLCERVPSPISLPDIDDSLSRHGQNLRETFFELFQLHEARSRPVSPIAR